MPFDFKFPYTNFHELNLDWILQKFAELKPIYRHKIHISGYTRRVGTVYDIDFDIEYISDRETPYTDLKEITLNRISARGVISNLTQSDERYFVYDIVNKNDNTYVDTFSLYAPTLGYTEFLISLDGGETYNITDIIEPITYVHT